MSLPRVILGPVSKTLVTHRTHLTHEQLEATRLLFCQFDRRETPYPPEATGPEGGETHGPRRSGKPGDQGRPLSILKGPAVSMGIRRDSTELPQAPRHATANSATAQGKWIPTFRSGKSGCWAAMVPPGGSAQELLSACQPRLPITHHLASAQGSEHRLHLYKVPSCWLHLHYLMSHQKTLDLMLPCKIVYSQVPGITVCTC